MNYIKSADQAFHDRNHEVRELKGLTDEYDILIKSIRLLSDQLTKLEERVSPLEKKIERSKLRVPELSNKYEELSKKAEVQKQEEKEKENKKNKFYRALEQMKKVKAELQVAGVPLENRN